MRFSIQFSLLLFFALSIAHSQTPEWERLPGPTGGMIESFARVGEDIVASTAGGAFFRSTDDGRTWLHLYEDEWTRNTALLHGTADDMLYALSFNNTWRSSDHGESWAECDISEFALYAASTADGTVLLGLRGSVAISTDKGESWSRSYPNPGSSRYFKLAVDAVGNWYAGGNRAGLHRSTDRGSTWTSIEAGLPNDEVYSVSVADGDVLYVGVTDGTFRSTDRGDTWTAVTGLGSLYVYSIQTTQLSSGIGLVAETYTGPRVSTDGGLTWEKGIFEAFSDVLTLSALGDGLLLASADGRVLRSEQGGAFEVSDAGLSIQDLAAIGAMDDGTVLTGGTYGGLYRSTDSGQSWQFATPNFSGYAVKEIHAASRSRAQILTGEGSILHTSDGGANWTERTDSLGGEPFLSMTGFNEFDAVSADGRFFHYSDFERGWEDRGPILPSSATIGAAKLCFNLNGTKPVHLVATDLGLYRSTDWGRSWNLVLVDGLVKWFTDMAVWGHTAYAADTDALYRSTDDGTTWTSVFSRPTAPRLLAFNSDGDFYFMDGDSLRLLPRPTIGQDWQTFAPPPFTDISCLGFFPFGSEHAGKIIVGTRSHGLFRSTASTLSSPAVTIEPASFTITGMYPLPLATDGRLHLQLELQRAGDVRIEICDVLGRVLQRQGRSDLNAGRSDLTISIDARAASMLLLRVHGPGGMVQRALPVLSVPR